MYVNMFCAIIIIMMHWCKTTQHNQFSHNYNVCQSCIIIIKSVFHNKLSQSSAVIINLNTKFYEYNIANELLVYYYTYYIFVWDAPCEKSLAILSRMVYIYS